MIDGKQICGLLVIFAFVVAGWYTLSSVTGSRLKKKFKYMPPGLSYQELETMLLGRQQNGEAQPPLTPQVPVTLERNETGEGLK